MDVSALFNAMPGGIAQGLIWGIMAIGVYITFRILDIADLSVDGTMCTGAAVCIMLMQKGYHIAAAMGIPAILAGILTQLGLWCVNLKIMGKANQPINVDKYDLAVSLRYIKRVAFYKNSIFVVFMFMIVVIGILYWFFGTELGSSLRATGCNENMARAQGINTNFNKVLGLMISNGLVAFASACLGQYQGFADINMGKGAIVIGLASVIIGEAIFSRIFKNFALKLLSVGIGGVIYFIVLQIVIWLGVDTDLLKLFQALIVAVFLAVPYWKGKHFNKGKKLAASAEKKEA